MAKLLPIAKLGEEILKQKASPINLSMCTSYQDIVEDAIYTLDALGERIGLAGPQFFLSKQLVIYRIPQMTHQRYQLSSNQNHVPLTVMINPTWYPLDEEKVEGWEACISLPSLMGKVRRFNNIHCSYYDLHGQFHQHEAQGFQARVIQHECDHLEGILFIERMDNLSSLTYEDVYLKSSSLLQEVA